MKKIFAGLMIIGLIGMVAGTGTFAYFTDTETSQNNVFAAGTVDLELNEEEGVPIDLSNMKPGDTTNGTITVNNVGDLPGHLYGRSWVTENDNDGSTDYDTDKTADEVAKQMEIVEFKVDGNSHKDRIPHVDDDGTKTLYDFINDPNYAFSNEEGEWWSYDSNMNSGEDHEFYIKVKFIEETGNEFQNDGLDLHFKFLLEQKGVKKGVKSIPVEPNEKQYTQLTNMELSDPFEVKVKAVKSNGEPFTGEITEQDIEDEYIIVTDHYETFDETPENRYYAMPEGIDFNEDGYATFEFGNSDDSDVGYGGLGVNEITETIEFNGEKISEDIEFTEMSIILDQ